MGRAIIWVPDNRRTVPRSEDIDAVQRDFKNLCRKGFDTKLKRYYWFADSNWPLHLPWEIPGESALHVIPKGKTLQFFRDTNHDSLIFVIYPLLDDPLYSSYAYYSFLILGRSSSEDSSIDEDEAALIRTTGAPKRRWKNWKAPFIETMLRDKRCSFDRAKAYYQDSGSAEKQP